MIKWKLMLTTLPFVAATLAVALTRDFVLHLKGPVEFSDVAPIFTSVSLIIGFMLAGVMTDYKESEKLPGEIAAELETLGDMIVVMKAAGKEVDIPGAKSKHAVLVRTVEDWLMRRTEIEACYAALDDFNEAAMAMFEAGGATYAARGLNETNNLRKLITRVAAIRRTSFLQTGYALMELLTAASIVLLLLANYKSPVVGYLVIGFLSLVYIYLLRLIRDVDNPFDYDPSGRMRGVAEVDPSPVLEYHRRLAAASEPRVP